MSTIVIIILCIVLAVLFCLCLSIANFSGDRFFENYRRLDAVKNKSGMTSLGFFQYINTNFFQNQLKIFNTGKGINAYSQGGIYLAQATLESDSLASFAIVAHELGHALQDKTTNKLKKMTTLRRLGYFIGFFMFPLLVAGLILIIFGGELFYLGVGLAGGGLLIFILTIVVKCCTISIEKEASKNAIIFLKEVLQEKEIKTCKKFLNDAKLTYWADMFRALLGWTMLTRKSK